MNEIKGATDATYEVAKLIAEEILPSFKPNGSINQFKVQTHPIISNFVHQRDKDILENERFETLVTLSRTIDDNDLLRKMINALKYKLII